MVPSWLHFSFSNLYMLVKCTTDCISTCERKIILLHLIVRQSYHSNSYLFVLGVSVGILGVRQSNCQQKGTLGEHTVLNPYHYIIGGCGCRERVRKKNSFELLHSDPTGTCRLKEFLKLFGKILPIFNNIKNIPTYRSRDLIENSILTTL